MSLRSQYHRSYDDLSHENQEIADLFTKLAEAVLRDSQGKQEVENLVELISERVHTHFRHEESGGYFAAILKRAPFLSSRAERLLEQHAKLLEQVETLRILVRSGMECPAWWNRIRSDLENLRGALSQHEAEEEKLVKEAFG